MNGRIDNKVCLVGAIILALCTGMSFAQEDASEQQLIQTLESSATLQQKDGACARLKRVGTPKSIPVLAALLTDKDLSHSARYALESMPAPEAGRALIDALEKTEGQIKAGIIHSLRVRHETGANDGLLKCLSDADRDVIAAAAGTLGSMPSPQVAEALTAALARAKDKMLESALHDALLATAGTLAEQGNAQEASRIWSMLSRPETPGYVRAAAIRGSIASASPQRALELVISGLKSDDGPARQAALEMSRQLKSPRATAALGQIVTKLENPAVQVAVIESLNQRGDTAAAGTLIAMADGKDAVVRMAAIRALGNLGDAAAVPVLVKTLASGEESERTVARQALSDLRHGRITEALIGQMEKAAPVVQRGLVRIVAERGDQTAVPLLLKLARSEKPTVQEAALQTLSRLAGPSEAVALVQLVTEAGNAPACAQAGGALAKLCARLQSEGKSVDAGAIASAYEKGNAQVRTALLSTAGIVGDSRLRAGLRAALDSGELRSAALKALCEARDSELLPDLLKLARQADDQSMGVQLVQGYVRLVSDKNTSMTAERRVDALQEILPAVKRADEKWAVLASLAEHPSPKGMDLALAMLQEQTTRAEAGQAITKIAIAISKDNEAASRAALEKVLAVVSDDGQRKAVNAALKKMDKEKNK